MRLPKKRNDMRYLVDIDGDEVEVLKVGNLGYVEEGQVYLGKYGWAVTNGVPPDSELAGGFRHTLTSLSDTHNAVQLLRVGKAVMDAAPENTQFDPDSDTVSFQDEDVDGAWRISVLFRPTDPELPSAIEMLKHLLFCIKRSGEVSNDKELMLNKAIKQAETVLEAADEELER